MLRCFLCKFSFFDVNHWKSYAVVPVDFIQAPLYLTITVLDIKFISGVEMDARFRILNFFNSSDACERDAKIFAKVVMQDIFQVDEDDASRHF
jgi:hypothetical protein